LSTTYESPNLMVRVFVLSSENPLAVGRVSGSSPLLSTKKEVTFVYQKLLLFLSKP